MATPTTSTATAKLNGDGSLNVLTSAVEMGQGLKTALAQIAATGCLSQTFYADAQSQLDAMTALAAQVEPAFVISKPFDPDLLRAAIAQALDTVSI